MASFTRKKMGCVLVVGWQADEIAEQLAMYSNNAIPHYSIPHYAAGPRLNAQSNFPMVQHIQADLSQAEAVKRVFTDLAQRGHHPELVVFQPEPSLHDQAESFSKIELEQRWRHTGLSLFLWAQAAIAALQQTAKQRQPATFVTLGSDLAIRPRANVAVDSALYAGMRAVMQSLAREFQPKGVHVAYIGLDNDNSVQAAASLCWQLHQQPRSAWTHEMTFVSDALA